jgi:hypothetical protein
VSDASLVMDWEPRKGDLLLLRVERQRALIRPPAGWLLMGRWWWRREQLWSRVVMPGDGTTITVSGLTGKAYLSVLRKGKLLRVATT